MPTPPHAIGFTLDPLDRVSEKRDDEAFVASLRDDPSTRFLLFVNNVPLFKRIDGHDPLFSAQEAAAAGAPSQTVFLGRDAEARALFAASFDNATESLPEVEAIELRPIAMQGLVAPWLVSALGEARSMLDWHRRHRFCANCGQPTDSAGAGWRRICPNCKAQHFPPLGGQFGQIGLQSTKNRNGRHLSQNVAIGGHREVSHCCGGGV